MEQGGLAAAAASDQGGRLAGTQVEAYPAQYLAGLAAAGGERHRDFLEAENGLVHGAPCWLKKTGPPAVAAAPGYQTGVRRINSTRLDT
jgi:hypothetical protein